MFFDNIFTSFDTYNCTFFLNCILISWKILLLYRYLTLFSLFLLMLQYSAVVWGTILLLIHYLSSCTPTHRMSGVFLVDFFSTLVPVHERTVTPVLLIYGNWCLFVSLFWRAVTCVSTDKNETLNLPESDQSKIEAVMEIRPSMAFHYFAFASVYRWLAQSSVRLNEYLYSFIDFDSLVRWADSSEHSFMLIVSGGWLSRGALFILIIIMGGKKRKSELVSESEFASILCCKVKSFFFFHFYK